MQKLDMKTLDITTQNIDKITALFPNCLTETKDEKGNIVKGINFDILRQELTDSIVEGPKERYQMTWPGKREALVQANTPIDKTLRPCREESVDFDTTQNLYIEGDNLEALKLLQESYLGKVKMIYIDPPYNTGKDFVYKDNFRRSEEEEMEASGQRDKEGGRLVANVESNGRFHSDWINMLYPRLKISRNLLREDGVIFISIDDNEVANLRKMCDEVFGEDNFISLLPTIMNMKGNNDQFGFAGTHEHTLVYAKRYSECILHEFYISENELKDWEKDEYGLYKKGANLKATGINAPRHKRPNLFFPLYVNMQNDISLDAKDGYEPIYPLTDGQEMSWRWSKEKFQAELHNLIITRSANGISIYKKQRSQDDDKPTKKPKSIFNKPEYSSGNGTQVLKQLFEGKIFDFPKPVSLMYDFTTIGTRDNDIILDLFSGSGTLGQAIIELNINDGGNRQFIMVQLPEETDEKSEAYKAGYKTIAEIGKERIRRVGKKLKEENTDKEGIENIDIGFRVLKIDSSNMKDVYYTPDSIDQTQLHGLVDNIKEDRTSEDLLFQVLLDWGVDLTLPIVKETIMGKEVYFVDEDTLAASFDEGIDETFVKELASREVMRVVFKDSGFASDAMKNNVDQIFAQLSPDTEVRAI